MSDLVTRVPVRLSPTPDQAALLRAPCQDYLRTIHVLVQALDSDVLPDGGQDASTKDFTAALPRAVKHQALRAARSGWRRWAEWAVLPVLRRPLCQWNTQNWRIEGEGEGEGEGNPLVLPVCQTGQVGQLALRCSTLEPPSKPGILRLKRTRGKGVAEVAGTLPTPEPTSDQGIMGIDLGVKVPAVVHVLGKGTRFFGTGRQQRAKRRQVSARRKNLQKAKQGRAVRKSRGKERRGMRASNHPLSGQIVSHAQQHGVGTIRLERLVGLRQRTARTSRGAKTPKARTNNRLIATWCFSHLATFIASKAERVGIAVEWIDPAYTSQLCPACHALNQANDRRYVCKQCGWTGHRDAVGAINNRRRAAGTGRRGDSAGAAGAAVA